MLSQPPARIPGVQATHGRGQFVLTRQLVRSRRENNRKHVLRTFALITTDSDELVAQIHDRMPVILAPADYDVGWRRSQTRVT
jgi:putative SOS response-associated peptidase YedK